MSGRVGGCGIPCNSSSDDDDDDDNDNDNNVDSAQRSRSVATVTEADVRRGRQSLLLSSSNQTVEAKRRIAGGITELEARKNHHYSHSHVSLLDEDNSAAESDSLYDTGERDTVIFGDTGQVETNCCLLQPVPLPLSNDSLKPKNKTQQRLPRTLDRLVTRPGRKRFKIAQSHLL